MGSNLACSECCTSNEQTVDIDTATERPTRQKSTNGDRETEKDGLDTYRKLSSDEEEEADDQPETPASRPSEEPVTEEPVETNHGSAESGESKGEATASTSKVDEADTDAANP